MDTLFIPNENDFRRWIREAMKECLENMPIKTAAPELRPEEESLLTRKEVAYIFRISLVTLHEWMKQGMPSRKQGGRVYFLRSEVMAYLKQKSRNPFIDPRINGTTDR
jgi:predicted DNA-binding transcriptional regulator AlpA